MYLCWILGCSGFHEYWIDDWFWQQEKQKHKQQSKDLNFSLQMLWNFCFIVQPIDCSYSPSSYACSLQLRSPLPTLGGRLKSLILTHHLSSSQLIVNNWRPKAKTGHNSQCIQMSHCSNPIHHILGQQCVCWQEKGGRQLGVNLRVCCWSKMTDPVQFKQPLISSSCPCYSQIAWAQHQRRCLPFEVFNWRGPLWIRLKMFMLKRFS